MGTYAGGSDPDQEELIDRVEYQADRVTPSGQSVGLNREAVYLQLDEAADVVLRQAPRDLIDAATTDGASATINNPAGSVFSEVELPADFLRFMLIQLGDWKRPVAQTIDARTDQFRHQYNTYTQADTTNPVVAKLPDPTTSNGQILHCYPQDGTPSISRFAYIGETAPENMPEGLKDIMVLRATARVLQAQKEQGAQAAQARADQQLQSLRTGQLRPNMVFDRDADGE
jgi:hypothetical protein